MDEISKKRKQNMLDEISETLCMMNKHTNALLDWYKKYENMEMLNTEEGKKLRKCISNICCEHAYAFMHLSNLEFNDVMENYPEFAEKFANKTTP